MSLINRKISSTENIQKQDLRLLLRLAPFLRPYKKIALIAIIALIFSSLAFLLFGQGIKLFIDEGIYTLDNKAMLLIAVVLITMVVATFIRFYFVSWIGERVSNDVRLAVFNHLLTLHPHYFEVNRSGEINARLTTDTTLLQSIFGFSISMALSSVLLFFGGLTMMIITNIKLALIVLVSVPIILLPMAIYGRRSQTMRTVNLYQNFALPNLTSLTETLRLGIPIALNIAAEFSFFAVIPFMIAHLGAEVVGAHAIAINIDSLAFMVPLGLAQALTIKVAHAQGSGNPVEARAFCLAGFKLVLMLGLMMSVAKIVFRHDIAMLFSSNINVQLITANLFFFAAALGAVDCLQMTCSGALRGYKDTKVPLVIQVIAFWVIAFPIAYSLALTDFWGPPLGVYGFWIGTVIAASIAAICLMVRWNLVSKTEIRLASQL